MDSQYNLQDVVRCHLCETPKPQLHCDICNKHVCKDCKKEHISNKFEEHKVGPFELRGCITKCKKHSSKICESYCQQCNIPVCELCASSKKHRDHTFVAAVKRLRDQKLVLQSDLQELGKIFQPKYKEIASRILVQKADLNENFEKLSTAINKHEEVFLRKIKNGLNELKTILNKKHSKFLAILNKQEDEIKRRTFQILQIINELNLLLMSNDVSFVSAYSSRNDEFRRLPPKLTITVPSFTPQHIIEEQIYREFGFLSGLSVKTLIEEDGYTMDSFGAESSPPNRPFIDKPSIITDIDTNCGLNSVSCLSNELIWVCGVNDKIMKL